MEDSITRKIYYKLKIGIALTTIERLFWKPYKIMSVKETIDYIVENRCSVARFGDGEFSIASFGCGLGFQREDSQLQSDLRNVIKTKNKNILICIPFYINMVRKKDYQHLGVVQKQGITRNLHDWMKYFSRKKVYGDANM